MTDCLYIATNENATGKRMITLGVTELAVRRYPRVGFFRPIVRESADTDPSLRLIRSRYHIETPAEPMVGVSRAQARQLLAADKYEALLSRIQQRFKAMQEQSDFVVVEGTSFQGLAAAIEFDLNADIAKNLGCSVMPVYSARDKTPAEVAETVSIGNDQLDDHGCEILATVVNQADPHLISTIHRECSSTIDGDGACYILPEEPLLRQPTLREIRTALAADLLSGDAAMLDREVNRLKVAAMQLPEFLRRMSPGSLVITPGDRNDILLACLVASRSADRVCPVGVLLTGGLMPPPEMLGLLAGAPQLPVLAVGGDTFDTATAASRVRAEISDATPRKIDSAIGLFERHVDQADLASRLEAPVNRRVTPMLFEYSLIRGAKAKRTRIVLPEGGEARVLEAVDILRRRDVCDVILLGDRERIATAAGPAGLSLDDPRIEIIDPAISPLRDEFADVYYHLRQPKGMTREVALDRMLDVSYFGTMLVHQGVAGGMVSGAAHTTAHTIRPAFEFIKTKPGVELVSSVFLMCLADRVLVYGDCAVNPNPTATQLADIAISSAATATQFGLEPRIAMLSYSTGSSGAGEDVRRVSEATALVRERRPDLPVEGPIQYDAAIDPTVAATKAPDSEVAGRATVFIFPDLNTGNNTYKAVQRSANALAIGPVLQGLNQPVNDLSRGCTVADIVNTVAITAIQAQSQK